MKTRLLLVLGVLASSSAQALSVPDCAGPVEVAKAHIIRTERNGVIVLEDGRAAKLEGIRLPLGGSDHAASSFHDEALTALAKLANGQLLTLAAIAPKEDRYDRLRVQAFSDEGWLQILLLKRGLARVSISPDRAECAAELYVAESEAQAAHIGIWSDPRYAVRSVKAVAADMGTFQIVQGTVSNVDYRGSAMTLSFGNAGPGAFTARISRDDMRNFRRIGVDPRYYAGRTVRVRGIVENLGGPAIEIANPLQVQVIP